MPKRAFTDTESRPAMFVAAAVVFGTMLIGAIAVTLSSGSSTATPTPTTSAAVVGLDGLPVRKADPPSSLPRPNTGRAPEEAGDPGGWEQGLVFALVAVGMLGIGVVVFRGGKATRARRDEWRAAAAPGQEEVRRAAHEKAARGATPLR